jgi:hypothetical protein
MWDKDRLNRMETSLGVDPHAYPLSEYEAVATYTESIERVISTAPLNERGSRWRTVDDSVIFTYSRRIPILFPSLAERVDISRAVMSMNDYIGGCRVPVARDDRGRVTHQAERTIYLPQPNYIAFYGGTMIDVTKLEFVRYAADEHKIYWRTVWSANDSADFDDGVVSFRSEEEGWTRIPLSGRQKFRLPPFLQLFNPDRLPELKAFLVTEAYDAYFRGTIANLEALFEGRDFRAGRRATVEDLSSLLPGFEGMQGIATRWLAAMGLDWNTLASGSRPTVEMRAAAGSLDENGFRHLPGSRQQGGIAIHPLPDGGPAPGASDGEGLVESPAEAGLRFFTELADAMGKDLGIPNGGPGAR